MKIIPSTVISLKFIPFFIVLFSLSFSSDPCSIGDQCYHTRTQASGEAKLISDCPSAIVDLKKGVLPSRCGFQGVREIVCCPRPPGSEEDVKPIDDRFTEINNRNERLALRKCREYAKYVYENVTLPVTIPGAPDVIRPVDKCGNKVIPLVVGGTLAGPREFPHNTLVGYGNNPIEWKCGGSIISDRYILTAGHCLNSAEFGPATYCLVGDLNYESDEDDDRPQQIKIKRHIPYTTYVRKTQYNDLALLELEELIKLNPYARPACLFTEYNTGTTKAIATGWGAVKWMEDTSSSLLKVTLELFTHQECNKTFEYNINRRLSMGIIDQSQLCAGSHSEEKDTCEGDSGGPLQIFNKNNYCMYDIIGVTSFGKACGTVGQPGVYTRVSNYVDWIEKEVWSNE